MTSFPIAVFALYSVKAAVLISENPFNVFCKYTPCYCVCHVPVGKKVKEMFKNGSFAVWSCYCGNELAGMIALRDCEHISLAFVRSDFHRQGIGRMLYAAAKAEALSHGTKSGASPLLNGRRISLSVSMIFVPLWFNIVYQSFVTKCLSEYLTMRREDCKTLQYV